MLVAGFFIARWRSASAEQSDVCELSVCDVSVPLLRAFLLGQTCRCDVVQEQPDSHPCGAGLPTTVCDLQPDALAIQTLQSARCPSVSGRWIFLAGYFRSDGVAERHQVVDTGRGHEQTPVINVCESK